jgi:hypothetical protein
MWRDRWFALGAGAAAWVGALLSSLCCLLPLAVIGLGLGSGAFMAVTMQYRWILLPAGVLGVGAGSWLYARERRRCNRLGCRMALDHFPEVTSDPVSRLMDSSPPSGHDMHRPP